MSEKKKIATREGFGKEIVALGKENPDILVVDIDIGKSCKTGEFRKELPDQYINVGIAEQNGAGVAAGLKMQQLIDDGEITDAHGRKVNFENTVIVMTSNAGSDKAAGSVGFGRSADAQGRERTMKALRGFLRPEFINRVDEIVYFHQLTEENIRSIARRMLDTIGSRMAAQGITLQADDDAVAALAKDGFDPRYGARPLRRTLQNEVEDVVAEQMLDGKLQSGDTAHVRLRDDKVVIEK